jgi:hypothetical protein
MTAIAAQSAKRPRDDSGRTADGCRHRDNSVRHPRPALGPNPRSHPPHARDNDRGRPNTPGVSTGGPPRADEAITTIAAPRWASESSSENRRGAVWSSEYQFYCIGKIARMPMRFVGAYISARDVDSRDAMLSDEVPDLWHVTATAELTDPSSRP